MKNQKKVIQKEVRDLADLYGVQSGEVRELLELIENPHCARAVELALKYFKHYLPGRDTP